jgi:hypothetical protein
MKNDGFAQTIKTLVCFDEITDDDKASVKEHFELISF